MSATDFRPLINKYANQMAPITLIEQTDGGFSGGSYTPGASPAASERDFRGVTMPANAKVGERFGNQLADEGNFERNLKVLYVPDPLTDVNGGAVTLSVRKGNSVGSRVRISGETFQVFKELDDFAELGKYRVFVLESMVGN